MSSDENMDDDLDQQNLIDGAKDKNKNKAKNRLSKLNFIKKLKSRNKSEGKEEKEKTDINESSCPKDKEKRPFFSERHIKSESTKSFNDLYNLYMIGIEKKTGLGRKEIFIILSIAFIFFIFGFFEIVLTYLITMYYPIKWTIEDYKNKKDDFHKMWGTYWLIFSLFIIFDFYKNLVLKIVPLYFIIRTVILLLLYLPGIRGAVVIYEMKIFDIMKFLELHNKKNKNVDSLFQDIKDNVKVKKD